jgi:hypothetical protein
MEKEEGIMSYIYRAAKAHQEELLREAQRDQSEGGLQAPQEKSLLKASRTWYQRLSSDLLGRSAGDAPTTA